MKNKLGDKQRLQHNLLAIQEIDSYTANISFDDFLDNSMMRFASIKQIEIIGEAANYIDRKTRSKFSTTAWQQITGMRNIFGT